MIHLNVWRQHCQPCKEEMDRQAWYGYAILIHFMQLNDSKYCIQVAFAFCSLMHVFTFDRLGYMLLFLRVLALAACLCTWLHPLEEQTSLCSTCQSTGLMMTSMHISRRAAGKLRDEASCNHFLSTSTVMHDHEE